MNSPLVETAAETIKPETTYMAKQRLAQKYGDLNPGSLAESTLVEEYIPLVRHIVARLAMSLPPHVDLQDVYSSGLVGLLNAIRGFNPEAGASFESYARFRIRGAIFDE